jgi:hypothetical protein
MSSPSAPTPAPADTLSRTLSEETERLATELMPPASRGPGFIRVPRAWLSDSAVSPDDYLEVPKDLNSVECLEFVGFDNERARSIFDVWQDFNKAWGGTSGTWVMDVAADCVGDAAESCDAAGSREDWDKALREMGLSADTRERILDPEFSWVRLTETASYWARDTIEGN